MDIVEIQECLMIRPPFLFVDFVNEILPAEYVSGYKNISTDEWFFKGQSADLYMPQPMVAEALSQLHNLLILTIPKYAGQKLIYSSSNNIRWYGFVRPGNCLDMEAKVISWRRGILKSDANGYVNGKKVCKAEFTHILPSVFNQYKTIKE